jgi:hypothetical protein
LRAGPPESELLLGLWTSTKIVPPDMIADDADFLRELIPDTAQLAYTC